VDELAQYIAFSLRPLKNAGLPCQGVTSPGAFGGRNLANYSRAVLEAQQDVFGTEIPFYLKKVYIDGRSPAPEVLCASGLRGKDPKAVVSIIGCTADWFGGWDGLEPGSVDQFISEDLKGGRLPEVIGKGDPAVLVSHWAGMYSNGEETGFNILQRVVQRLHSAYENLLWMKFSELARYWAARELTSFRKEERGIALDAPFACPDFTIRVSRSGAPRVSHQGGQIALREVDSSLKLESGTWMRSSKDAILCFDLRKGPTHVEML
jgi:hypothetical protein